MGDRSVFRHHTLSQAGLEPVVVALQEVCGWINEKATVPVWAKMTPNVTDITQPARVALEAGVRTNKQLCTS